MPREINPHISPGVEQAILQALSLHPDQRPASVEELQEQLQQATVPSSIAPLLLTEDEWRSAWQRNLPFAVAVTILILIAIVITP
jgi:serine/threonine-protein kinase